jgi:RimJ/RimL family protein N-acetyltransferase
MIEQHPEAGTWDGLILHKADHVLIGDMGFKGGPDERGMVEIGYSIIPEYQGRGYATEMARALIAWAFSQPDITVVTAECFDDNIGSIRVLEKVGMRRLEPEGHMLKWEIRRIGVPTSELLEDVTDK